MTCLFIGPSARLHYNKSALWIANWTVITFRSWHQFSGDRPKYHLESMGAISLKLLVEGRRVNAKAKKTNITYEGIDFQIKKKNPAELEIRTALKPCCNGNAILNDYSLFAQWVPFRKCTQQFHCLGDILGPWTDKQISLQSFYL